MRQSPLPGEAILEVRAKTATDTTQPGLKRTVSNILIYTSKKVLTRSTNPLELMKS